MHRNVNIKIVTVQAAVDDEHSNPTTTIKPDVSVILRADRVIVMREWIKKNTHMYSRILIEYLHADVAFMQESARGGRACVLSPLLCSLAKERERERVPVVSHDMCCIPDIETHSQHTVIKDHIKPSRQNLQFQIATRGHLFNLPHPWGYKTKTTRQSIDEYN